MKAAKAIFYFLFFISVVCIYLTGNSGCANILPPTGGPRDSLPPVMVSAVPRDFSLNFKTNQIIFTFDEYVNVDKIQENLIISPTPKINPIVTNKLRTVTVKLKDTLRPNTTYQLNFGNAIRDVDENNILKNFTYVFSTGAYIDSLQFSGKVIIARSGKVDSTLLVFLHKNLDDSAVVKDRPDYVTRVDSAGYFTFNYIAAGTYAVYAMKDESGSRKYLSKSQLFAFADHPVEIKQETPSVTLYAYEEELPGTKKANTNVAVAKPSAKELKEKEKDKRLVLKTNLNEGKLDVLGNLELSFATPLKTFDSTKIRFTDEEYKDIKNYHFITDKDTTHKTIELVYNWALETKYNVIAEKDFAQDSAGRMLLKIDTISFTTRRESDYGSLSLRFFNLDLKRNPVLQFKRGEEIKFSFPLTSREFKRTLFLPGQYQITILYDDNKNGVWDPGEFFGKHKQPEKVEQVNFHNKKNELNVKSSWDNELDITL